MITVDNEHTFYCYSCGTVCGAAPITDPAVPVMGRYEGEPWCDICLGNLQLCRMAEGLDEVVYISSDGRSFTTWAGTKLGQVRELGAVGGIYDGSGLKRILARLPVKAVHWSGVTEDGVHVYGRTGGPGMVATAHVRRHKGRIVVEQGSTLAESVITL